MQIKNTLLYISIGVVILLLAANLYQNFIANNQLSLDMWDIKLDISTKLNQINQLFGKIDTINSNIEQMSKINNIHNQNIRMSNHFTDIDDSESFYPPQFIPQQNPVFQAQTIPMFNINLDNLMENFNNNDHRVLEVDELSEQSTNLKSLHNNNENNEVINNENNEVINNENNDIIDKVIDNKVIDNEVINNEELCVLASIDDYKMADLKLLANKYSIQTSLKDNGKWRQYNKSELYSLISEKISK